MATPIRILCITGLPGSGKSIAADWFARSLAKRGLQSVHYTTDWMRYQLYPELQSDPQQARRDFTAEELLRTYHALFTLINEVLCCNPNLVVITDGTYRLAKQRQRLGSLARAHGGRCQIIYLTGDEQQHLARLQARSKHDTDAALTHYLAVKATYERPRGSKVVHITNNQDLAYLRTQIEQVSAMLF